MDRVLRTMRYVVILKPCVSYTLEAVHNANTVLQSAVEQAKDEQVSDFLRGQYKSVTGSDMPIKDKETRFG